MVRRRRRWVVWFGSVTLHGRAERRRAQQDLQRGLEPAARYTTGKFWDD